MDRVRNQKILLNKEVLSEGLFPTLEENFSASNTLSLRSSISDHYSTQPKKLALDYFHAVDH